MAKWYQLVSAEPLTEFEESVLKMLQTVAENGTPVAMAGGVLLDSDEVITFYHHAELKDRMVIKDFLDLDIQTENILNNLPWFIEQAEREGLIGDGYMEDGDYPDEE